MSPSQFPEETLFQKRMEMEVAEKLFNFNNKLLLVSKEYLIVKAPKEWTKLLCLLLTSKYSLRTRCSNQ